MLHRTDVTDRWD